MQQNHRHLLKTRGKGKLVSGFSPKMEVQSSVAACDDDRQHLLPDTQQQEQDRQEEQKPQQQQQQQQQEHFHVLAVDDSVIDRKLLEKLLKVSSYQVTCVESGDKALEYLGLLDNLDNSSSTTSSSSSVPQSAKQEGMKVNLIMTDYCMPGISGYDLLKRVKGSSWKDVPVVVMSSENIPSRISMCLEGGAEQFLLKPLQLSDVEKLQYYLLKSPDHDDTCKRIDNNTNDFSTEGTDNRSSNYSNVTPKRKAASSDPQERVPKMKGVFDLGALELHLLPNTVRSKFGDQI